MGGAVTLSRALVAGGQVIWEPGDRPRLLVPPFYAGAIRGELEEVRKILARAVVFRRQLDAAQGRPNVPLLILPEAPATRTGACISCGKVIAQGWRCPVCLTAVLLALNDVASLLDFVGTSA